MHEYKYVLKKPMHYRKGANKSALQHDKSLRRDIKFQTAAYQNSKNSVANPGYPMTKPKSRTSEAQKGINRICCLVSSKQNTRVKFEEFNDSQGPSPVAAALDPFHQLVAMRLVLCGGSRQVQRVDMPDNQNMKVPEEVDCD